MRVSGLAVRTARVAALALTGMTLALLPACSALFGFDDYNDSTADLCDLAKKCYDFAACQGHIGPKLDGADADERAEWLAAIPTKSCLDSCAKSRKCLNMAPVCSDVLSACDKEEECCGFLSGKARCREMASAPGGKRCCLPDGVQTLIPGECCSGVYNPKNSACGKNVCRPEGTECTDGLQCCSGVCRDFICAEEQCLPLDTPCSGTDFCCDGAECLPSTGACGFPNQCRDLRQPCTVDDPSTPCCVGLQCQKAENKHPTGELYDGLCQDQNACAPKGYACDANFPCCNTNSNPGDALECRNGECRAACSDIDTTCNDNADCCSGKCEVTDKGPRCVCAQIYCEKVTDCCSGICIGGVCTAACAKNTVCHDECVPGPALVTADVSSCPKVDKTCVDKVCAADPFCCCVEWDSTCVTLAVKSCTASVCN